MFGKRKRPWKKAVTINRVERNNGDVRYELASSPDFLTKVEGIDGEWFESRDAALDHVDAWWATYWPMQTKSTRRA